jgi:hypothetical protein
MKQEHADNTCGDSGIDDGWSTAFMAAQPKLGLLSQRWPGVDPADCDHFAVNRILIERG